MTVIDWDRVSERRYETGLDHGVLYPPNGPAVPWNGLVSINETVGREVKSYYLDGVKFLDHFVPGSYSGKLVAFTYPDELDELVGTGEFVPGVFIHDQRAPQLFTLSYRTQVGNAVDGIDHGYKIHILYNLLAVLSDTTLSTVAESVAPQSFEWTLLGTPSSMYGIRPTSHISLDSRRIDPTMLVELETLLYGSSDSDPELPSTLEFLNLVSA